MLHIIFKVFFRSRFGDLALPAVDPLVSIVSPHQVYSERSFTVNRSIVLTLALMGMAGVASAKDSDKCFHILWFDFCPPSENHEPLKAPEIDPSSAMAGLTLMIGGLAVLRGRRSKISKE
jgi:hypothetical protein